MRSRTKAVLIVAGLGGAALGGFVFSHTVLAAKVHRDVQRHHQSLPRPHGLKKIEHVVFIVKENRTFDHYFGTFPGVNGATSGTLSTGQVISLGRAPDATPHDIDHSYQAAVTAIDGGAMDKLDLIARGNVKGDLLSYTQYTAADLQNYFAYARHFSRADGFFSSRKGPSSPSHLCTCGPHCCVPITTS